jgi:hypothetical protein
MFAEMKLPKAWNSSRKGTLGSPKYMIHTERGLWLCNKVSFLHYASFGLKKSSLKSRYGLLRSNAGS